MKKREPVRKKENLIYFPDLEKRLTERGLESLKAKKFKDAIQFLEDARELDDDNSDILVGLVLAYFEAAHYQKAKDLAKEMLLTGVGDYFQMVDLYLTILIQLHEYQEIVSTVEALLDEKEIPHDKAEHFLTILKFSKRMAENHEGKVDVVEKDKLKGKSSRKKLDLFSLNDPNEQMRLISELSDKNLQPFIGEITDYLKQEQGHPFLKTLLLNLLKDQEYDKEMAVSKFKLTNYLTPSKLPEINTQPRMNEIIEILKDRIENSDPILFENVKSLVERHFLITYPFRLEPEDANSWAAAFHFIALEYYGSKPVRSRFVSEYGITSADFEAASSQIKEIEEISYPII